MNIEDFITSFGELFEETDVTSFNENTEFRNIDEWDSLTAMSLIAMADSDYNVKMTGDEIKAANTIGDLFKIVKEKII